MELRDKIMQLRKSRGWSQEELAEKLDVTRQSVSKWESGQSVPDLERILRMSELFQVSTDALLKDEETEGLPLHTENGDPLRRVGMEEAERLLSVKAENAPKIGWAVFACIVSFLPLMLLAALQEAGLLQLTEKSAGGLGLCVMFAVLAGAVAVFVMCGMRAAPYEYLEKEEIAADPEVIKMAKQRQEEMQQSYVRSNTLAVFLCILSLLPLFGCLCITDESLPLICSVCIMLVGIAFAVRLFICAGIPWGALKMLLQEGDYSRSVKRRNKGWLGAVSAVYWLLVTAVYLLISFLNPTLWGKTWIIWPIAGVLFGALTAGLSLFEKK